MTFREALADALLHFVWQGAIIGLVTGLALQILRSRSAAARYAVCLNALAASAIAPIVTVVLLSTRGALFPAAELGGTTGAIEGLTRGLPNVLSADWLALLRTAVLPLWIAGALACSARLFAAWRHVTRLRTGAEAPPPWITAMLARVAERLGVNASVEIAMSRLVDGPSVIGWLRPLILLPASVASGLTATQLETILAHELAHIRRYDYLANLLQTLVETLLFFHPVVWWLSARARRERELCCDDVVLVHYDARVSYARALVSIERMRFDHALALGAADGQLGDRVRRILGETARAPRTVAVPALVVLCIVAACVGSVVEPKHEERAYVSELAASPSDSQAVAFTTIRDGKPETIAVAFKATRDTSEFLLAAPTLDLVGRHVAKIQMKDIPSEAEARFALPIRLGDVVTTDSEQRLERAVHAVSESFSAQIVPSPNGQAAVLIEPYSERSAQRGMKASVIMLDGRGR